MAKRPTKNGKSGKKRGKFASPFSETPIADKLLAALRRDSAANAMTSPEPAKELQARLDEMRSPKGAEDDLDRVTLHYLDTVRLMLVLGEAITPHPVFDKLMDRIAVAEELYGAGGPGLNPVTHSMFMQWSLLDAHQGLGRETLGSVVEVLQRSLGLDAQVLGTMGKLNRSRLGVWVREASRETEYLKLRELVTGITGEYTCESGWVGEPGDLLLARVLPPPSDESRHGAILMTPYVLASSESAWMAYFARQLPRLGIPDHVTAYEQLMKYGVAPAGDCHWLEFIDVAFAEDLGSAMCLAGVPDGDDWEDNDDDGDDDDDERKLVFTTTGEMLLPARLYWTISSPDSIRAVFAELRCIGADVRAADAARVGPWHWLYQEECESLVFGTTSHAEVPPEVQPVHLGTFRLLAAGQLVLEVRSHERAVAAARFFGSRFGANALLTRGRVLNRLIGEADVARGLAALDALLDHDVVVVAPGENSGRKDVPLVEDFPVWPEDESPDFADLQMLLALRAMRAQEHWRGNTEVTLRQIIESVAERSMALAEVPVRRGKARTKAR